MAARFPRSCTPDRKLSGLRFASSVPALVTVVASMLAVPLTSAQILLKASQPGEEVTLMPSDLETLESDETRKDLPCTVTERKPELGFDLRFHSGYEVTVPLRELAGQGDMLTVLFRVHPDGDKARD